MLPDDFNISYQHGLREVNKPRLLIIDDNISFAKFVANVANKECFDVGITTRVQDFMAAFSRAPPDLIVLDILISKRDGIELIQWLAEHRTKARVIVATGFRHEYATMARSIGMGGIGSISILHKPVRVVTLKAALGNRESADPGTATQNRHHLWLLE